MRPHFFVLTALLLATPAAAQPALPPDFIQLARTAVDRLIKGDYVALFAAFDEKMRAALPEEKLRGVWATVQSQAGALRKTGEPKLETKGGFRIVVIPAEFEKVQAEFQVAFSASGSIVGLNIRPAAPLTPFVDASYIDRNAFNERDLTVDAGGWPLPGTLSLPTGAGPFPAVVLVHGSGPNDRDESIGPNKTFRDLAHGLASRGVAVLRYDKRTREHAGKVAAIPNFTVKEETVDDAAAAIKLLRVTAGIDPQRVFVLGHSLGGMLAPRIAAASPDARGLIILAGAVKSLEQSIVDQVRYMAMDDGVVSADEKKQIDDLQQLVERIKALKPTDPPEGTGSFSAPASYWVDLRGYDPPAAARSLKIPMLILQGERDYQVPFEDFGKWKAALDSRTDVTFKSYPALNHLFIAGTGRSMPMEYMTPGHVTEEVVRDIVQWISRTK